MEQNYFDIPSVYRFGEMMYGLKIINLIDEFSREGEARQFH